MDGVASAAMKSDKLAPRFYDGADEKGRHRRTAFWRGKSVTVAFFSDKVRWWECEGGSYGAGENAGDRFPVAPPDSVVQYIYRGAILRPLGARGTASAAAGRSRRPRARDATIPGAGKGLIFCVALARERERERCVRAPVTEVERLFEVR